MSNLRVGMKVRLNSGGPIMTIKTIEGSDDKQVLTVVWMTRQGEMRESKFTSDICHPDSGLPPEMILL